MSKEPHVLDGGEAVFDDGYTSVERRVRLSLLRCCYSCLESFSRSPNLDTPQCAFE